MKVRSKVSSKNEEKKKNNHIRPVYSLIFIIMLVLVSIAYASLAISLGVRVNKEESEPVINEITSNRSNKPNTPSSVNKKSNKPPVIPEVVPRKDLNWKIEFQNINVQEGSVQPIKEATIDETKTGIAYEVLLNEPGDYYSFQADIVNSGTVDAKIYNIIEKGITSIQERFLDYQITYADGTNISIDDTLLAKQTKTINVLIKFKEDLNATDLPSIEQDLNLSYRIIYIEK